MKFTLVALVIFLVLLEGLLSAWEVRKTVALEAQLVERGLYDERRVDKICGPRPGVSFLYLDRSIRQQREYNACLTGYLSQSRLPYGTILSLGILILVVLGALSWWALSQCCSRDEKKRWIRMAVGEDDAHSSDGWEEPSRFKVFLARVKRMLLCRFGDLTSIEEERLRVRLEAKERERRHRQRLEEIQRH